MLSLKMFFIAIISVFLGMLLVRFAGDIFFSVIRKLLKYYPKEPIKEHSEDVLDDDLE